MTIGLLYTLCHFMFTFRSYLWQEQDFWWRLCDRSTKWFGKQSCWTLALDGEHRKFGWQRMEASMWSHAHIWPTLPECCPLCQRRVRLNYISNIKFLVEALSFINLVIWMGTIMLIRKSLADGVLYNCSLQSIHLGCV